MDFSLEMKDYISFIKIKRDRLKNNSSNNNINNEFANENIFLEEDKEKIIESNDLSDENESISNSLSNNEENKSISSYSSKIKENSLKKEGNQIEEIENYYTENKFEEILKSDEKMTLKKDQNHFTENENINDLNFINKNNLEEKKYDDNNFEIKNILKENLKKNEENCFKGLNDNLNYILSKVNNFKSNNENLNLNSKKRIPERKEKYQLFKRLKN